EQCNRRAPQGARPRQAPRGPEGPGPAAQLFPYRPDRRRAARDHDLHHLVVHHPGRRLGEAARPRQLSARDLPALRDPRLRAGDGVSLPHPARVPHREPGRAHAHRRRRSAARADAGGARPLQGGEADFRDRVQAGRQQLSPGRADRMAGRGAVVDLLRHRAGPGRARGGAARRRASVRLRPVHPEPDHGLSGHHGEVARARDRHDHRRSLQAPDVDGHPPAGAPPRRARRCAALRQRDTDLADADRGARTV
ncbi:MAG: Uncharacterized membrane anchored protein Mext_4159, partial [uncultured Microvirga sp.]